MSEDWSQRKNAPHHLKKRLITPAFVAVLALPQVILSIGCSPIGSSFSKLNPPFARRVMQTLPETLQPPAPTTTPTPSNSVDVSQDTVHRDQIRHAHEADPVSSIHPLQAQDLEATQTPSDSLTQSVGTLSTDLAPIGISTSRPSSQSETSPESLMSLSLVQPLQFRLSESILPLVIQLAECSGEDPKCQNENIELLREFKQTGQVPIPTPLPPETGYWRPSTLEISWRSTRASSELLSRVSCLETPIDPTPARLLENGNNFTSRAVPPPTSSLSTLTYSSSAQLPSQAEGLNSGSQSTLPIPGSALTVPFSYEVSPCILFIEGRTASNFTSMRSALDSIHRIRIRWQRFSMRTPNEVQNLESRP